MGLFTSRNKKPLYPRDINGLRKYKARLKQQYQEMERSTRVDRYLNKKGTIKVQRQLAELKMQLSTVNELLKREETRKIQAKYTNAAALKLYMSGHTALANERMAAIRKRRA